MADAQDDAAAATAAASGALAAARARLLAANVVMRYDYAWCALLRSPDDLWSRLPRR